MLQVIRGHLCACSRELKLSLQTLIVVYDQGSPRVLDLVGGLPLADKVVFVVPDLRYSTALEPILSEYGEVIVAEGELDTVCDRLRSSRPDGIVTFSELALQVTSELALNLGLPFHDAVTTRALRDKYAQRKILQAHNVDCTPSYHLQSYEDLSDAARHVGFPAVVKPINGFGGLNTARVNSLSDADSFISWLFRTSPSVGSGFILERFLEGRPSYPWGDYVSVESIVVDGESTHIAVTGKFPSVYPFREAGDIWPAPGISCEDAERIEKLTSDALAAIGVQTGLTHTEIKLTQDGPRIIEVNGRLGGHICEMSRYAHGPNFVELGCSVALGLPVIASKFDPAGVFFQHHSLTPISPCRLIRATGMAAVRKLEGVDEYSLFVRPGDELPGGIISREMDCTHGHAENHQDMLTLIDIVLDELRFEFEGIDSDILSLSGSELLALNNLRDETIFTRGRAHANIRS